MWYNAHHLCTPCTKFTSYNTDYKLKVGDKLHYAPGRNSVGLDRSLSPVIYATGTLIIKYTNLLTYAKEAVCVVVTERDARRPVGQSDWCNHSAACDSRRRRDWPSARRSAAQSRDVLSPWRPHQTIYQWVTQSACIHFIKSKGPYGH